MPPRISTFRRRDEGCVACGSCAAAAEPEAYQDDTFERWLGFLQAVGLVEFNDADVTMTGLGREFLSYIVRLGYDLYKRG